MLSCVWYVSKNFSRNQWERALIGSMASALRERGVASVALYSEGGTAGFGSGSGVRSWGALSLAERAGIVFGSELWHLWGEAPWWWFFAKFRSRTVHTGVSSERWRGHPALIYPARATQEGEAILVPTFDVKASRNAVDNADGALNAIYVGLKSASPALRAFLQGREDVVNLDETWLNGAVARSGVFITSTDAPSEALQAAYMTMQGLTVISAAQSVHLRSLLGSDGFLPVDGDTVEAWEKALTSALSNEGRMTAVQARHFIKSRCSDESCADSFVSLYREVTGGGL